MTEKRIILEMGTGNDLYGLDYTKAACRAVHDALHHSSIVLFKSLGYDHRNMRVQVTIGVQEPDKVDIARVCEELPRGRAEVTAVFGGDGEEGHVGRSGNDHRGTGPGKGVDGDAQGSEDRRGQGDPPRLDGPTVAAVFKLNQRLLDGLARPGRRVAEKPLFNSLLEACLHGGGGAEIHLRYPCSKG